MITRPGKKSELADMAANLAKAKGWLPLQLRHPSEGAA